MQYNDGTRVRIGDRVRHGTAAATVETIIEGDEVSAWSLQEGGFLLLCDECGRVFVEPGYSDWEDVVPVRAA